MANTELARVAEEVKKNAEFNKWLQAIGKEGQQKILKIFAETVKQDQKLASMAQEDPESTIILFAYLIFQLQKKQNQLSTSEPETEDTIENNDELEDMNNPPVSNPITAKFGAKLNHIVKLNGHCPEGYEIQYYKVGGTICSKCAKKKLMLTLNMACGGKKRIKKGQAGINTGMLNFSPDRNPQNRKLQNPLNLQPNQQVSNLQSDGRLVDTYSSRNYYRRNKLLEAYERGLIDANLLNKALKASENLYESEVQLYQDFPSLEEIRMIQDPVERKRMEEEFWKRHGLRYQLSYKKGGKTLTKAKAKSLKYKGGPGDINSTEGMKPNKKQKKMLCKRIGGMVNNAKKITIYSQPDMFDVIH